jgi:hypothetical protein
MHRASTSSQGPWKPDFYTVSPPRVGTRSDAFARDATQRHDRLVVSDGLVVPGGLPGAGSNDRLSTFGFGLGTAEVGSAHPVVRYAILPMRGVR